MYSGSQKVRPFWPFDGGVAVESDESLFQRDGVTMTMMCITDGNVMYEVKLDFKKNQLLTEV